MDIQKYIDRLDQDRRDMEQRITEERRLSEERIEKRFSEATEASRLREERMDKRFTETMARIDRSLDKTDETKRWIIGVCLTTIIGIAAMVITVIITAT